MDSRWLTPGDSSRTGSWSGDRAGHERRRPLVLSSHARASHGDTALARRRVDVLTAILVGAVMCAFCFVNLSLHGYPGVGLFASEGFYRENIALRVEMFEVSARCTSQRSTWVSPRSRFWLCATQLVPASRVGGRCSLPCRQRWCCSMRRHLPRRTSSSTALRRWWLPRSSVSCGCAV